MPGRVFLMTPYPLSAWLLMLLVLTSSNLMAQEQKGQAALSCPKNEALQDSVGIRNFTVLTYGGDFEGCLEVRRHGALVFSERKTGKLVIGNDINKADTKSAIFHPPAIPLGTDITGLGKPNVIVAEWSGGAHCCFTFHVLELGSRVREVGRIQADDSDYAHFEDINHDGKYEFLGWDFDFAYWNAGFAQSPAPQIVLRFDGRRYELAPDFMRRPALSTDEFNKRVTEVRDAEWTNGNPPPELWGTILDLIYTGNSDLAWKFTSAAWIPGDVSERQFLRSFCGQLAKSRYFAQLRPTIKNAPCEFDPKNAKD